MVRCGKDGGNSHVKNVFFGKIISSKGWVGAPLIKDSKTGSFWSQLSIFALFGPVLAPLDAITPFSVLFGEIFLGSLGYLNVL